MTRIMWKGRGGGTPPPSGYFVSPTGSATGAGTIGDPWTLAQACLGGYPTNTIQPGDTVWLRGGTYTAPDPAMGQGHFACLLNGTSGAYITFRCYPGEHPIIDGNYNNAVTGDVKDTVSIEGRYQIWRNLEVFNSQTNRYCNQGTNTDRGDAFGLRGRWSKIVNCVLHDTGEGMGLWTGGFGGTAYGNLNYHNGYFAQQGSGDCAAAIDIAPAGGSAVTISGSASGDVNAGSSVTFSHNHSGDYLVVVAGVQHNGQAYTGLSATYNGVAMTLLHGMTQNPSYGSGPVALFGIASPPTGAHNVVVSWTDGSHRVYGIAQSVVNAHQTNAPTAKGGWAYVQFNLPPFTNTVSSATNHLIVDGYYSQGVYGYNRHVESPATIAKLVGDAGGSPATNAVLGLSYAAGAASVAMTWDWTPIVVGHGHGCYFQELVLWDGNINTTAGDNTVTADYGAAIWYAEDVGSRIVINGAGPGGTVLSTTITAYNNQTSIEVADAPSVTNQNPKWNGLMGRWAPGKTFRHNVIYDQFGYCTQLYGGSSAAALQSTVSANLFVNDRVFYGGLAGYRLDGSVATGNYHWSAGLDLGYHMADMADFALTDNYAPNCTDPPTPMTITGNTFIGPIHPNQTDYPDNTYDASNPTTNVVVIFDNEYQDAYDAKYGVVFVYNWENLTSVSVDISSIVPNGTAIDIRNAQDYFNDGQIVYSGTYNGGTVSLPMTGLTAPNPVGYNVGDPGWDQIPEIIPATGQAFNCFIVVEQGKVL